MSGHCPGCGTYCEEDDARFCGRCVEGRNGILFSAEHRRQFIAGMLTEAAHAYRKHGARPWSKHEFYAVLLEEVDEAWDAIKSDKPIEEVLKEIMQVACVCLRYAETPDAYKGRHKLPLPCRGEHGQGNTPSALADSGTSPGPTGGGGA